MSHRLPRTSPTQLGVDPRGIEAFLGVAEADLGLHSFMMARHGQVIAEGWWSPYAPSRLHLGYSLSKMVTASVIGTLVDEGRLRVEDPVLQILAREASEPWPQVTVEHCLTMTLGHTRDAWGAVMAGLYADDQPTGADPLDLVLALPPDSAPGTLFTYNQVATYLLSRIIEKVTGETLLAAARSRLLVPLGADEVLWHADPLGHHLGFSGVHLTTETVLHLAQVYLDEGRWGPQQLLSPDWVRAACQPYPTLEQTQMGSPDWDRGYGYALWQSQHGSRGDGAYGQFALVLPEQGLAIATTAEEQNMQAILDAVWTHLLPACSPTSPTDALLPTDADTALAQRLRALALPTVAAAVRGPGLARFSTSAGDPAKKLNGAYQAASVQRSAQGALTLTLERHGVPLTCAVGEGEWAESTLRADGAVLPVMVAGGWADDLHFEAEVLVIETPHRFRVQGRVDPTTAHPDGKVGSCTLAWRESPLMGDDPLWLAAR